MIEFQLFVNTVTSYNQGSNLMKCKNEDLMFILLIVLMKAINEDFRDLHSSYSYHLTKNFGQMITIN